MGGEHSNLIFTQVNKESWLFNQMKQYVCRPRGGGGSGVTHLAHANVVAAAALDDGRVVVDVQDVDGQRVVRVPGRGAVVRGAHLSP